MGLWRAAGESGAKELVQNEDGACDADGLAETETDEDAEKDRRGEVELGEGNCDACIGEREDRHDEVGRPRLELMLKLMEQGVIGILGNRNRDS